MQYWVALPTALCHVHIEYLLDLQAFSILGIAQHDPDDLNLATLTVVHFLVSVLDTPLGLRSCPNAI
jgi:hypothetical protein